MPPMGSKRSQLAQRKAKAQAKKPKSLAKKPKPPAKNLRDKETAGCRKRVPTCKARELDIAELASEEEGSNDANFVPSAIPLPDSDDGSSGTESEEPVPVEAPPKRARGRPPKKKEEAKGVYFADFLLLQTFIFYIYRICALGAFGSFR